ncbi:MAG: hypothetical protein JHD16_04430 [Solirubrobacteraceae bacterium]|nr:hypothetical protein [Solirubrobacteraceae bacterium]
MYSLPGMRRRLVIFSVAMITLQMVAYTLSEQDGMTFWASLALSIVVVATVLPFYATLTAARWKREGRFDRKA